MFRTEQFGKCENAVIYNSYTEYTSSVCNQNPQTVVG